jgi:Spy/CpxP family protein refolding chaperone
MKTNSTISATVALALMAASCVTLLGLAASVRAQTPAAPAQAQAQAQAPAVPVQPKINLTLEQRHVIKELIKDLNIASAPKNTDTAVGATVPASVNLTPMPQLVAEKIPQIKTHLFFVEEGKVVIVDPKENKIVDAID